MALLRGLAAILRSIVDQGDNGLIRKTSATAVDIIETTDDIQFGKVGIGVAPLYPLHVQTGAGSGATPAGSYDDVVLDLGGTGGVSILAPDANNANITLGNATDSTSALWQWDGTNSRINFGSYVAGADVRMRSGNGVLTMMLTSDNRVAIGTPNAPGAMLRVEQTGGSGGIPALILDQDDVSEEFTRYEGTAGANVTNSLVAVADVTSANVAGYIRVNIQDSAARITSGAFYVPFYTLT